MLGILGEGFPSYSGAEQPRVYVGTFHVALWDGCSEAVRILLISVITSHIYADSILSQCCGL